MPNKKEKEPPVPVPTKTPVAMQLYAAEAFELLPGAAGRIPTIGKLTLPVGAAGIIFPEVLQLAGPQAAAVVTSSGDLEVPVYNMNPTRRLSVAAGERVGCLIVVPLIA